MVSEGKSALQAINKKKGLGFDEWDLDFYTKMFTEQLKRDPTDVECFDLGVCVCVCVVCVGGGGKCVYVCVCACIYICMCLVLLHVLELTNVWKFMYLLRVYICVCSNACLCAYACTYVCTCYCRI
jgi:hypothetical protein